jgi:predicted Zn finger-like uncharacterized protein
VNVTCPECRSVFRVDPSKLPAALVRARCSVCGGLISVTPSSSVRDEFAAPGGQSERAPAAARPMSPLATAGRAAPPAVAASPQQMPTAAPAPPPQSAPVPRPAPAPIAGIAPPNLGGATAAALLGRVDVPPPSAGMAGAPQRGTTAPPPRAPSPARAAMPFVRPGSGRATPQPGPGGATPFGVRATPPAGQNAPRRPINPFLANDPNAKARRLARALISDMITYFPEKREEGLRTGALKQMFEEEITKSYGEYVEQVGREFAEGTPHFQDALNEILAGGRKLF